MRFYSVIKNKIMKFAELIDMENASSKVTQIQAKIYVLMLVITIK